MKILKVFDNGGRSIDRYSVVVDHTERNPLTHRILHWELGLSANPTHPQGFSQWGLRDLEPTEDETEIQLSDLPENVQKHVLERMKED